MNAEQLLKEHAGMLMVHARRLAWGEAEVDDLLQEGRLALLEAWERFDAGRGFAFKTYARALVRNRMIDWIRGHRGLVRVPASAAMKGVWTRSVSLDEPLRDEPELTLGETLAAPEPEEMLPGNNTKLLGRLWAAVEMLPARERWAIGLRYGGAKKRSMREVREIMGLPRGTTYLLMQKAINRLRGMLV